MSIKIDELQDILIQEGISDSALRSKIIKAAEALEQDKKEDREANKGPKSKFKLTVLIRCAPENEKLLRESAAFIVKSPEDTPDDQLLGIIKKTAIEQNRNAKRKGKIFTWQDWFGFIKGKFRKPHNIVNTTKSPVQILPLTDEQIDFGS